MRAGHKRDRAFTVDTYVFEHNNIAADKFIAER